MLETLSLLVHADSKVGKTTLAASSPGPILALDAEGGWKFVPMRKIEWDPRNPPPDADGSWDVCVVVVREFETMRQVYAWLVTGQHRFRSLVVDSITEIQRRCKQNLAGTEAMKQQDWGQLLTVMDNVIRGYRDLTLHPVNPIQVVTFIAETRQSSSGKWRPYMQGQIDIALPYWMDIVGYLYVDFELDANGQPQRKVRKLLVAAGHPQFESGERVQGRLGDVVVEPNITSMLTQVYPHLAQ